MPRFTIGMAHSNDFHGVYFSIQAMRLYFPALVAQSEFVVVNNGPENNHSKMIGDLLTHVRASGTPARLIQQLDPVGTSPARNRIMAEATGDYVLSMDCHVLLEPGSFEALDAFYTANPDTGDLITGPMIYDNIKGFSTHFNDEWRSEMWGTWGRAWGCYGCKKPFSVREADGKAQAISMDLNSPGPLERCVCGVSFAAVNSTPWAGHESKFLEYGHFDLGADKNGDPFEIPGHGLGFYSCKRDKWQGFNVHARAFGGEELWYHEKIRRAGYRALCHPGVRWLHRFGRPEGVQYPLTMYDKIRNYVLEFSELGMDLTPVRNHFVGGGKIGSAAWAALAADPIRQITESAQPCNGCQQPNPVPTFERFEQLLVWQMGQERDLNQHIKTFGDLAAKCDHVTEFSHRRDSTIGLIAGLPKTIISYNLESGAIVSRALELAKEAGRERFTRFIDLQQKPVDSPAVNSIEPTGLLFLDTKHTYDRVSDELKKFAPTTSRFIVLHDTVSFGATGDDGGPGLVQATTDFLKENKKWFLYYHTATQYGLTVLATQDQDIPVEAVAGWVLGFGPGTELFKLLQSIGIQKNPTCDCNAQIIKMDAWGVAGCKANQRQLADFIETNAANWGWDAFLQAAFKSVWNGLAFKINPLDRFHSLVGLAIEKAAL